MKKITLLLILMSLITSCTMVMLDADDPYTSQLKPNQGALIISIVNNTFSYNKIESISVINIKDELGVAIPLNQQKAYYIDAIESASTLHTSYFAANLNPGVYRIGRVLPDASPSKSYYGSAIYWDAPISSVWEFGIQPNQTADLGQLVFSTYKGRSLFLMRSSLIQSNPELLNSHRPSLWPQTLQLASSAWLTPFLAEEQALEKRSRGYGLGFYNPLMTKNGHVVFGGRLGQFRYGKSDTDWSRYTISETLETLRQVTVTPKDWVVVGGDRGFLGYLDDSRTYRSMNRNDLPVAPIVYLGTYKENGITVGLAEGTELRFYQSASIENPSWEALPKPNVTLDRSKLLINQVLGYQVGTNIVLALDPKRLLVLGENESDWVERSFPKKWRKFSVEYGERLLIEWENLGAWPAYAYSDDLGKTWQEIPKTETLTTRSLRFINPTTAYQSLDMNFQKKGIRKSVDSGQTWEEVAQLSQTYTLTPFKNGDVFYGVFGREGALSKSTDEGKTWTVIQSAIP